MGNRIFTFGLTVFLLVAKESVSQSDFDFSQRHLNEFIYNPAATGNNFSTGVYFQAGAQWVGMPGAPYTEAIAFSSYFYGLNSAAGFSVTGDQIGFTNTYVARLSYAYYIPVFRTYALSFGLSGALMNRGMNASGALVDDLTDGELYYGNISEYSPDFDFGFELTGGMKDGLRTGAKGSLKRGLKIGATIRHFAPKVSSDYFKPYSTHLWSYASMELEINRETYIEPVFSYAGRDKFHRFELGAFVYFKRSQFNYNKYWLSGLWRFNGQFAVLAGVSLTPNLKIGYSFDHAAGELTRLSDFGSHEIFISWQKLKSNKCQCAGKNNKLVQDIANRFYIY